MNEFFDLSSEDNLKSMFYYLSANLETSFLRRLSWMILV